MSSAIPAVVKGIVGGAAQGAAPLVNTAANSATAQQTNNAEVKVGNADSYPLALDATKALKPSNENANQGLMNAANIEKDIGAPVGQAVKQEGGLNVQQDANTMKDEAHKVYLESIQKTNDATIAAETALKNATENAKINPQEYLESLGTDGQVLTAIGMVLSGIGSGLTGQPNLAMDLYNRNTDRAIKTQQMKFQNMMASSAQAQGLLKTAQDRQAISSAAYNAAVMSVMSGNNAAMQGAGMQIKTTAAPELIKQMQYENDIKFQQANDAFSKSYINTMQSGDTRQKNLLGAAMVPLAQHFTGDSSFNFNGKPASDRAGGGNSTGRPYSMEKAPQGYESTPPVENPESFGMDPAQGAYEASPLAKALGDSSTFSGDEDPENVKQAGENWKNDSLWDKFMNTDIKGGIGVDKKKFLEKYGNKK